MSILRSPSFSLIFPSPSHALSAPSSHRRTVARSRPLVFCHHPTPSHSNVSPVYSSCRPPARCLIHSLARPHASPFSVLALSFCALSDNSPADTVTPTELPSSSLAMPMYSTHNISASASDVYSDVVNQPSRSRSLSLRPSRRYPRRLHALLTQLSARMGKCACAMRVYGRCTPPPLNT